MAVQKHRRIIRVHVLRYQRAFARVLVTHRDDRESVSEQITTQEYQCSGNLALRWAKAVESKIRSGVGTIHLHDAGWCATFYH